jgi:signal transduction histidine kinase
VSKEARPVVPAFDEGEDGRPGGASGRPDVGLTAAAAGELIATDPLRAKAVSDRLQTAIRAAVADVRRLAYDLRPPTLDELGLVEALRERTQQYTAADGAAGLRATIEAPDALPALPALPAAVEVAAYRIVQEALMNVTRHAQARTCVVRVACPAGSPLRIDVVDDGIGLPDPTGRRPGLGLRSMQERASELGGGCAVERAVPCGTRVSAWLPVAGQLCSAEGAALEPAAHSDR